MSSENVELVRRLLPPSGVDLAQVVRSDDLIGAVMQQASPHVHPDFDCVADWEGDRAGYKGLEGLRELFLDWLSPWASYRSETEDAIDLGDRVVILVRDYGRRPDSDVEIDLIGGSLWTFRDGKIAHAEFYARRSELLEAAGLAE